MGDKTPESLSMDQYFDRLRSDHSPSIFARSGRTNRCQPRSRLSQKRPVPDSAKRLMFEDDGDDEIIVRKRKSGPIELVDISSSQSGGEADSENSDKFLLEGGTNKRRRSVSNEPKNAKKLVNEDDVATAQSSSMVVPFADGNGNNCVVRPEMRRCFTQPSEVMVDEAARRASVEKARRVVAMEQFQRDILNDGEDYMHYISGADTDQDDDLFDGFNKLQME